MSYKATIRIPTGRDYEFIELHDVSGDKDDLIGIQREFTDAMNWKEGLPDKDFKQALDRYLIDGTGETAQYLAMGTDKVFSQQDLFQQLKKAFARIKSRNGDNE